MLSKGLYHQLKNKTTPTQAPLNKQVFESLLKDLFFNRVNERKARYMYIHGELLMSLPDEEFISVIENSNVKFLCAEDEYNMIMERYKKLKNNDKQL